MAKFCNERTNEKQPTSNYEPFAKSFLLELQVNELILESEIETKYTNR